MIGSLVKIAFTALALAAWQLFFQPLWNSWIQSQGHTVGFGETALGYAIALSTAWLFSALVVRRLGGDREK